MILESAENKVTRLEKKRKDWERRNARRQRGRAENGLPTGNEVFDEKKMFKDKTFAELTEECKEDLFSGLRCKKPREEKAPEVVLQSTVVGIQVEVFDGEPHAVCHLSRFLLRHSLWLTIVFFFCFIVLHFGVVTWKTRKDMYPAVFGVPEHVQGDWKEVQGGCPVPGHSWIIFKSIG